jgi:hypothetical protein
LWGIFSKGWGRRQDHNDKAAAEGSREQRSLLAEATMMMESNDDAVTAAVPSSPLPPPQQLKISHVILDLDGTLIDTETLVEEASELIVSGYGKKWNGKGAHKRLGKRPLESAASLIQDYDLPCTPQELHSQILAFMKNRHANSSDPSFFFYSQLFFALLPQNPSFLSCSIGFFPVGITCWNEYCWLAGALRERSLSI